MLPGSIDLSSHRQTSTLPRAMTVVHHAVKKIFWRGKTEAGFTAGSLSRVKRRSIALKNKCGERGFKSHLGLGFFWVYVSPRIYVISMMLFSCSEVSIKTRSRPASFSFKGQATNHTTVKKSIIGNDKIYSLHLSKAKSKRIFYPSQYYNIGGYEQFSGFANYCWVSMSVANWLWTWVFANMLITATKLLS